MGDIATAPSSSLDSNWEMLYILSEIPALLTPRSTGMCCGGLVPSCLLHRQHGASLQQFQHFISCETWQPQASPTSHVVTLFLSTTTEQREKVTAFCQRDEAEAGTCPFGHLSLQFGGTPWAPLWAGWM